LWPLFEEKNGKRWPYDNFLKKRESFFLDERRKRRRKKFAYIVIAKMVGVCNRERGFRREGYSQEISRSYQPEKKLFRSSFLESTKLELLANILCLFSFLFDYRKASAYIFLIERSIFI